MRREKRAFLLPCLTLLSCRAREAIALSFTAKQPEKKRRRSDKGRSLGKIWRRTPCAVDAFGVRGAVQRRKMAGRLRDIVYH